MVKIDISITVDIETYNRDHIESYLKSHGWICKASNDVAYIFSNDGLTILLPIDETIGDFQARIYDLIRTISEDEGRPQWDVYSDLFNPRDYSNPLSFMGLPRPDWDYTGKFYDVTVGTYDNGYWHKDIYYYAKIERVYNSDGVPILYIVRDEDGKQHEYVAGKHRRITVEEVVDMNSMVDI